MNITKQHHEERSEPDERGMLEWEYVYDVYTFSEDKAELRFRQYRDEAAVATLLSPHSWSELVSCRRLLGAAAQYLWAREGIALVRAYHPARGDYRAFEEAAHSAVSAGMISSEDAQRLVRCVHGVEDAV